MLILPDLDKSQVRQRVRQYYNFDATIAEVEDRWHRYASAKRHQLAKSFLDSLWDNTYIRLLNIGAGSANLQLPTRFLEFRVDLAEANLIGTPRSIAADICALPYPSSAFDCVMSIGSVINYTDAVASLVEMTRVLRPGGWLVLEYESSRSAEFLMTEHYNQPVSLVDAFYKNSAHSIWVISPSHLSAILDELGLIVKSQAEIHIISPWFLALGFSPSLAALAFLLERHMNFKDRLAQFAANIMIFCQKHVPP